MINHVEKLGEEILISVHDQVDAKPLSKEGGFNAGEYPYADVNNQRNWKLEDEYHPNGCGELCGHCAYEKAVKFQETLEANYCQLDN